MRQVGALRGTSGGCASSLPKSSREPTFVRTMTRLVASLKSRSSDYSTSRTTAIDLLRHLPRAHVPSVRIYDWQGHTDIAPILPSTRRRGVRDHDPRAARSLRPAVVVLGGGAGGRAHSDSASLAIARHSPRRGAPVAVYVPTMLRTHESYGVGLVRLRMPADARRNRARCHLHRPARWSRRLASRLGRRQ